MQPAGADGMHPHCTARADLKVTRLTCIPSRTSCNPAPASPRLPSRRISTAGIPRNFPRYKRARAARMPAAPTAKYWHCRRGCGRVGGKCTRSNVVDIRGWREELRRAAKGETARYFRAVHFFTESRVHAADVLTDAENAGAPLWYTYAVSSPFLFPSAAKKIRVIATAVNFRPEGKKEEWSDMALIYRISVRQLSKSRHMTRRDDRTDATLNARNKIEIADTKHRSVFLNGETVVLHATNFNGQILPALFMVKI